MGNNEMNGGADNVKKSALQGFERGFALYKNVSFISFQLWLVLFLLLFIAEQRNNYG